MTHPVSALISAADLKALVGQPHVKILDASFNQPASPLGIPGALDFDIDRIADPHAPFAHTAPTPQLFAEKVGALGISNNDTVIVYDRAGLALAAARAWWMFRLFGHDNVKILDGGLPAWIAAGGATAEKAAAVTPTSFTPHHRPELFKRIEQVADNLLRKQFIVLDARDSKRFNDGHIPQSTNVPYISLVTDKGALKSRAELEKIFHEKSVDLGKKIACSCGSGVTACVIALALHEVGHPAAAVYDGSWTEWGASSITPKMQGTGA